jgi:ketosteroid isomerase-like protein
MPVDVEVDVNPREHERLRTVLLAMYAAIDANDFDVLGAAYGDDAVFHRPGTEPLRGRRAIVEYYAEGRGIEGGRHVVEHVAIDGACGAAWGTFDGRLRDGTAISLRWADCFSFAKDADGARVATRTSYLFLIPVFGGPGAGRLGVRPR